MYSREDEKGWKQSTTFKKAFSVDVDIYFLGVWYILLSFGMFHVVIGLLRDTVDSVGVFPRQLPFTMSNIHVKHFRHALALDEHQV